MKGRLTCLPKSPSLDGYKTVLTEAPFLRWLMNSFFTSVSTTAFTIFTSALAGYIFAKFRFKGQKVYFLIILATMMTPFQVLMIPRYLIITDLGLINNIMALADQNLVTGFGIFLSKQFIEGIPNDLIEAAPTLTVQECRTFWSSTYRS